MYCIKNLIKLSNATPAKLCAYFSSSSFAAVLVSSFFSIIFLRFLNFYSNVESQKNRKAERERERELAAEVEEENRKYEAGDSAIF